MPRDYTYRKKIFEHDRKQSLSLIVVLLSLLISQSCIDQKIPGPIGSNTAVPNLTHKGIWITNEGGFTLGQASLSFLDLVEDSMYNNVFQAINGRPLGDVLQSISYYNGRAFLVLNNSQKIEVVDSISFQNITTINDLNAPRELVGYKQKLFVSDLYSDKLTVLDANSYTQIDAIDAYGWTNKMIVFQSKLFVTVQQTFINNVIGSKKGLLIMDADSHEELAFVNLPQGANSLQLDRHNNIWVLCDGGLEEEIGGLFKINPISYDVERELYFPSIKYAGHSLTVNQARDKLYFIAADPNEGLNAFDIVSIGIEDTHYPNEVFLDGGSLYIYGFFINEEDDELYFNDAVGLIQEGFCYRLNFSDQTLIRKYKTGIFPSQIYLNY